MSGKEYALGQSVRLAAAFATFAGVRTDPTTVTFKYAVVTDQPPPEPTATSAVYLTDPNVIRDSAGVFHYDFVPAASGDYVWQAVGTGAVAAACPLQRFRVLPSPFA